MRTQPYQMNMQQVRGTLMLFELRVECTLPQIMAVVSLLMCAQPRYA